MLALFEWIPDAVFAWYWPVWLLIGFGIPEAIALVRTGKEDTLSERVRQWFGTSKNPKGMMVQARRVALLAAMAWLTVHWLTDGSFM